jgi:hypothetical protein
MPDFRGSLKSKEVDEELVTGFGGEVGLCLRTLDSKLVPAEVTRPRLEALILELFRLLGGRAGGVHSSVSPMHGR